jgi:arabinan endo-1,5-alpha-L-arabinosidase
VKAKYIKLMGILTIIFLMTSPAFASTYGLQNAERTMGALSQASAGTYTNPLPIEIPGDGLVESCADPTIIYGQTPDDPYWYMYCTTDPLNDEDKTGDNFNFHLIPTLRSDDLVNWEYMGDVFSTRPGWVADDAGLWAPEIQYFNDQYYLYYGASWTDLPGGGSAIGVATSDNPLGPWVDSGGPVVEPHAPDCCPGDKRWVFDPEVVRDEQTGQLYIFYGSYFGGISARELSADGLHSDPATRSRSRLLTAMKVRKSNTTMASTICSSPPQIAVEAH